VLPVVAVAFWAVGLAVPAPGAPRGGVVVVTPSTKLRDGQTVEVSSSGWPANSTVGVTEMFLRYDNGQITGIDGGQSLTAPTGPHGSLKTAYEVQRFVGSGDCARLDRDDRCMIAITRTDGNDDIRLTAIHFAPK
jgi:hypothetical protein